jgi:hypothetical protein
VTIAVTPYEKIGALMSRSRHSIDVFNFCVNGLGIGSPQVIDALTNTGSTKPESRERLEQIGDRIAEQVPQALDSAIDNFIESNSVTQPVTNVYPIDERFVPITHAEMREIFGRDIDQGWDNFRARYPHTRGTLSVSDIGFDDAYTQAILCVGRQFDSLAGYGTYYVLNRKKSEWSLLAEVPAWIS